MKRLAELASRLTRDVRETSVALGAVPRDFVFEALEAVATGDVGDRVQLLRLLAVDARDDVRERVARELSRFVDPLPVEIEELLATLCGDASAVVRFAATASLGALLQSVDGITRTRLVGLWASSAERAQRAAIALALGEPFVAVGVPSALELLAGDDDPEVRARAAVAVKTRLRESPGVCATLLRRLASDPDPIVRRSAT